MENINENEQWKSGGDCSKCRRQNYCSKECSQCSDRSSRMIKGKLIEYLNKKGFNTF
jgi:predicted nucleic-acid-binding Zn-ribbon protein